MGFRHDQEDEDNKKSAKKVEEKIYRFYSATQEKRMLEKKMKLSEACKKQALEDISSSRIRIACDVQGMRYDADRVSSSLYQQSPQERAIDTAFRRLEDTIVQYEREILLSKSKIAELNQLTSIFEVVLDELEDDEIKFVEEKYKLKQTMRSIAMELNISETGLFRFKDRLLQKIKDYLKKME